MALSITKNQVVRPMKGVLLAGGRGTRLLPLTQTINKHLLPVYDKPLIYYSLSTLMLAGIRDVAVVVNPEDKANFQALLGDGSRWGMSLSFIEQDTPGGIVDALICSEAFIDEESFMLSLGDNLFFGSGLTGQLESLLKTDKGAGVLLKEVPDPQRFGIATISDQGAITEIEEKPTEPKSNLAITGLYIFDETAMNRARELRPSARGEIEITDLLTSYVSDSACGHSILHRGTMWMDTGTLESYWEASTFIRSLQTHSGALIGSPEEISWRKRWINGSQLGQLAANISGSYGAMLQKLILDD